MNLLRPRRAALLTVFAAALGLLALTPPALAAFPGKNGLIVFGAGTESGVQLFTVRSNGRDLKQITQAPGSAVHPDWAPDGRSIVYEHDWDTESQCATVDRIDPDGGNRVSLTSGVGGCQGQPAFMPRGAGFVYEHFDFDTFDDAVWGMTANGGNQHRIIGPWPNETGFATDPNVSPDGSTLSFIGFDGALFGPPPNFEPAQGLFTSDLAGNHLTQLLPFDLDLAVKHDWAPNGERIAVTTNANFLHPDQPTNIATLRPDGSGLRFLTHYPVGVNAFLGSYSPDGKYIVFRLEEQGRYALMKMRSDGSHLQTILGLSSFRPRFIDWGARPKDRSEDD